MSARRRPARVALLVVDSFVAVTATGGGIALVTGIDTAIPAAWLAGTPFESYVIPGLILAVVVGGSAALATVAVLRGAAIGARASLLASAMLSGWIVGEALILSDEARSWIEAAYLGAGLLMATLALDVGRPVRTRGGR